MIFYSSFSKSSFLFTVLFKIKQKSWDIFLTHSLLIASFAKPLCISERDKALLTSAIWNDTLLLSSLFVMDYSLVVGIDETNGQYVVGIIGIIIFFFWIFFLYSQQ